MTPAPLIGPIEPPGLHVMSFNVRRRVPPLATRRADRWPTRAPLVRALLKAERPTLLGVQEALPAQAEVVGAALGARYRSVGTGRDATGSGERCSIFFDADRLELASWRQLALSATPDVAGSTSWGNAVPRVVVEAVFEDRATGAGVVALNTHLDHLSRRSRWRSAGMLARLAHDAGRDRPDAALILTGDLNTRASGPVVRRLADEGGLRDAWTTAPTRLTPAWGTYSGYRRPRLDGRRIDVVLVGGAADAVSCAINAVRVDGAAASDHEPVQAVVRPRAAAGAAR